MNVRHRSTCFVWLLAVAFDPLLSPTARAEIQYTITDLGSLGLGDTQAYGINNRGQVTGESFIDLNLQQHAFLWNPTVPNGTTGTMYDLGDVAGSPNEGFAISDSGYVTGGTYPNGVLTHAFVWTPTVPNGTSGTMSDLGSLGGIDGLGVNSSGHVVGIMNSISFSHAFLYDGTMHDLDPLGGTPCTASGINNSGMVTGSSIISDDNTGHAFLWIPTVPNGTSGTMHDLGTLGGKDSGGVAINASGMVAGISEIADNTTNYHAFLYDGSMHDLGTLDGFSSYASSINNSGQVVGNSNGLAFLYDAAHGMVDLNTLIDPLSGWQLQAATGINDAGQIVGYGVVNGEDYDAFLLTPVAEPSSVFLTALAAISVFIVHRSSVFERGPKTSVESHSTFTKVDSVTFNVKT